MPLLVGRQVTKRRRVVLAVRAVAPYKQGALAAASQPSLSSSRPWFSWAAQHEAMSTMPLVAPEAWRPPVEFWGCDPVWRSSVKILAAHLARLPWAAEGDVCWLNNHPIRDLDIVGIVVGLDPSQVRVRVRVR